MSDYDPPQNPYLATQKVVMRWLTDGWDHKLAELERGREDALFSALCRSIDFLIKANRVERVVLPDGVVFRIVERRATHRVVIDPRDLRVDMERR